MGLFIDTQIDLFYEVKLKHFKFFTENYLLNSECFIQTDVFYWSRDLQGVIFSAFSYGYAAEMPFGGLLTSRFWSPQGVVCWRSDLRTVHNSQPSGCSSQSLSTCGFGIHQGPRSCKNFIATKLLIGHDISGVFKMKSFASSS